MWCYNIFVPKKKSHNVLKNANITQNSKNDWNDF